MYLLSQIYGDINSIRSLLSSICWHIICFHSKGGGYLGVLTVSFLWMPHVVFKWGWVSTQGEKKTKECEMNWHLRCTQTDGYLTTSILHLVPFSSSLEFRMMAALKGQALPDCKTTLIILASPFPTLTSPNLLPAVQPIQSAASHK